MQSQQTPPIITNDNYYTDTYYMSVSSFKKFDKCEVDGLAGFGAPSLPMMVGSYVDAYVEGTLDEFIAQNPYIKPKDAPAGHVNVFKADGGFASDFVKANEVCRYINSDPTVKQFLSGDKQTIMTGKIGGIPFKIKMDSYSKGIAISDLKVMATVTTRDGEFYDFVSKWGYDIQLACYQEIVYQNTGERLPCFIVALTKESPINSVIVGIEQYIMDKKLYYVESKIERFYDVRQGKIPPLGCERCNSCITTRGSTPIISMEDFVDFFE